MINVAIIGFGLSGRYLQAPFFEASLHYNLHSIVTTQQKPIGSFNDVHFCTDINDVLNNEDIDLISICTPNNTHVDFAQKVLQANKHVMVEKPFTPTYKEAVDLIEMAEKQQKVLAVFQNRRFDSDFLTIKKIIESDILGTIKTMHINFNRFKPELNVKKWKEESAAGNGILYDLGSHILDQAIALFGTPIKFTGNTFLERANTKIDDAFELKLEYANDLKVILKASLLVKENTPRYFIEGSKGSCNKYGIDVQEDNLKAGLKPTDAEFGIEPIEQMAVIQITENGQEKLKHIPTERGSWSTLFDNLYEVITDNKSPLISQHQVVEQIKIMQAIKEKSM